ncbi:hypothetical protein D3C84_368430 [compost metagenome]
MLDGHLGIALGDPAHGRRVPLLAIGIHAVIRRELYATESDAVKHLGARAAIANHQLTLERNDRPRQGSADVLPLIVALDAAIVIASAAALVPGRLVTQAPRADIQTAVEAKELAIFAAFITTALATGDVVGKQERIDPLVPQVLWHFADGTAIQGRLGNADVQPLAIEIKYRAGMRDRDLQIDGLLRLDNR